VTRHTDIRQPWQSEAALASGGLGQPMRQDLERLRPYTFRTTGMASDSLEAGLP